MQELWQAIKKLLKMPMVSSTFRTYKRYNNLNLVVSFMRPPVINCQPSSPFLDPQTFLSEHPHPAAIIFMDDRTSTIFAMATHAYIIKRTQMLFVSPLFGRTYYPTCQIYRRQTKATHPSRGDQWWAIYSRASANGRAVARGFRHGFITITVETMPT